jgi:EmrB/QacA subfamily drug resistance transporter
MVGILKGPCEPAAAENGAAGHACANKAQPWVLAATILGSSMAFIDGSVVGVAIPVMQRAFHATAVQMQWVNNAYLLFLSALILLGGAIGDRIGRRLTFLIGIFIFTVASIGGGLAPSEGFEVLARAVQGVGAAMLVPSSLAILGASFEEKDRGKAIGTWAGASAMVTALAPVMGGWLVDSVSWRAIFWINVPIAASAIAVTLWRMPENKDPESTGRLDYLGAVLAAIGLAGVAYGLSTDPHHTIALIAGLVSLVLFVIWEARIPNPLVPLSLFRDRRFVGANLLTLFLYFAMSGAFFFIPFQLIQVKGFSATAAGAAFLPFTILMGAFSRWSGGLVERFGGRLPLTVGPIVTAVGLSICALDTPRASYWTSLFPGIVVFGLGMTIAVAPLTTVVMSSVPPGSVGAASGVNNAVSRVAGLLAVAVMGFVVARAFSGQMEPWISKHPGPVADAIRPQIADLAAIRFDRHLPGPDVAAARTAIDQSFTLGFRDALLTAAVLSLLAGGAAFTLIRDPSKRRKAPGSRG